MNERDQKPEVERPINTNAAPTIVAFTFQFERALYSLFSGHGKRTLVGIETLDDVAELTWNADGTVAARLEQCVFRTNVTGRFGIVTGDFGNVTGHFGNVTERTGRQEWRCA